MRDMNTTIDPRDRAIELVENGFVSTLGMLTMCLKYMSHDDVIDMLECNELDNFDVDMTEDEENPVQTMKMNLQFL